MNFFRRRPSLASTPPPHQLTPIGYVRNDAEQPLPRAWDTVMSQIVVEDEYVPGLTGLAGFERITVVFWMDRVPEGARKAVALGPGWAAGMPAVGVFATRTQFRPNPIGITVVELMKIDGNTVTVVGLDALNGTPVLDLRPYLPPYDAYPNASMPPWVYGPNGKS